MTELDKKIPAFSAGLLLMPAVIFDEHIWIGTSQELEARSLGSTELSSYPSLPWLRRFGGQSFYSAQVKPLTLSDLMRSRTMHVDATEPIYYTYTHQLIWPQ